MAATGHPIAGDVIYCPKNLLNKSLEVFNRLMLHSYKISFFHPKTHKEVEFQSKIPSEFKL